MGISVICWAIFLLCFARNRSSYLNCPLLFIALTSSVPACCALDGAMAPAVFIAALVAFTAAILLVPFFLIINGIIMLRREGMSLPNMLSLFLGLAVGVGEIACVTAVLGPLVVGNVPSLDRVIVDLSLAGFLVGAAVLYGSLSFLMFALYSIFLMIIPRKRDYDYVIIHGAGLLDGSRISRLLAERLDKAIEVYRRDPTPPVLIPSGGRGRTRRSRRRRPWPGTCGRGAFRRRTSYGRTVRRRPTKTWSAPGN